MRVNRRDFIRLLLSASATLAMGGTAKIVEPWLVEEINIVDLDFDEGWKSCLGIADVRDHHLIAKLDVPCLYQYIRLMDNHGHSWRVTGEMEGIRRDMDGFELIFNEGIDA